MDQEQKLKQDLALLREGVRHWKRVECAVRRDRANAKCFGHRFNMNEEGIGYANCALCKKYHYKRRKDLQCKGCPVFQNTGQTSCAGTPYTKFSDTINEELNVIISDMMNCYTAAIDHAISQTRYLEERMSECMGELEEIQNKLW